MIENEGLKQKTPRETQTGKATPTYTVIVDWGGLKINDTTP
jgi:hypothetical protein